MAKKKEYVHEFVIDRSKWQRISYEVEGFIDKSHEKGFLVNETLLPNCSLSFLHDQGNNRQCCLGFYCESVGIPAKNLKGMGSPEDLPEKFQSKLVGVLTVKSGRKYKNTEFADDLININDDNNMRERDREKKIIQKFAEKNIKVTFVGVSLKDELKKLK